MAEPSISPLPPTPQADTPQLAAVYARVRDALHQFDTAKKRLALEALNITVVWHPDNPLEIQGHIHEVIENYAICRPHVPAGDRDSV